MPVKSGSFTISYIEYNFWYMTCLVSRFMKDLNTLDISLIEQWFCEESSVWIPPAKTLTGKRRIMALFKAIFRKYKALDWTVTEIFELGNSKFMYQTSSSGILGNNEKYSNEIITVIQFSAAGTILSLSDYFKDTTAFQ